MGQESRSELGHHAPNETSVRATKTATQMRPRSARQGTPGEDKWRCGLGAHRHRRCAECAGGEGPWPAAVIGTRATMRGLPCCERKLAWHSRWSPGAGDAGPEREGGGSMSTAPCGSAFWPGLCVSRVRRTSSASQLESTWLLGPGLAASDSVATHSQTHICARHELPRVTISLRASAARAQQQIGQWARIDGGAGGERRPSASQAACGFRDVLTIVGRLSSDRRRQRRARGGGWDGICITAVIRGATSARAPTRAATLARRPAPAGHAVATMATTTTRDDEGVGGRPRLRQSLPSRQGRAERRDCTQVAVQGGLGAVGGGVRARSSHGRVVNRCSARRPSAQAATIARRRAGRETNEATKGRPSPLGLSPGRTA